MKKCVTYKNGNSLSYAEFGDSSGFPILIQHGLIASIEDSQLFERLISSGTRLISLARPGYGDSSSYAMKNIGEWGEIVSVLVAELGLAQFDVFGISSGAPYSYAIGYKLPERVRNIFILSGTPALYDEQVLAQWTYPVNKDATIGEMQALAYELFFANLSDRDRGKNDIKDSMRNNCFGVAQDLKLRVMDWGFRLSEVRPKVYMRHSRTDDSVPFVTAELTANLLPNCTFEARANDAHFSSEVLDDFLRTAMMPHYVSP